MSTPRPQAEKLFAAMMEAVNRQDPELLDIIEAGVNVLQVSVGQFGKGQGWTKEQTIAKAEELVGNITRMIDANWDQYPKPLPSLNG